MFHTSLKFKDIRGGVLPSLDYNTVVSTMLFLRNHTVPLFRSFQCDNYPAQLRLGSSHKRGRIH